MPDREKIIKGLKWILNDIEENGHYQVSYYADEIRDALAMLKEQEAAEPKWASGIKGGADALCGSCMAWLSDHSWSYCPRCGRKVKWNG